jgi:hypothetical protein
VAVHFCVLDGAADVVVERTLRQVPQELHFVSELGPHRRRGLRQRALKVKGRVGVRARAGADVAASKLVDRLLLRPLRLLVGDLRAHRGVRNSPRGGVAGDDVDALSLAAPISARNGEGIEPSKHGRHAHLVLRTIYS